MQTFEKHPYKAGADRFSNAQFQFTQWEKKAASLVNEVKARFPKLELLDRVHSLCIAGYPSTVQIWFGKRFVPNRLDHLGKSVIEDGAYLVYSLGAAGHVLVVLYPAKSGVHSAVESNIRLEVKEMSLRRLEKVLPQHLKDLVAYHYVTSLDGVPTFLQTVRVWWLRTTCTIEVDGKASVRAGSAVGWIMERVTQAALASLFKPIALLAVLAFLTWRGWEPLARLLGR